MTQSELASRVLRVLVVDDERLARLRLRALLADCRAPHAEVAAEAIDAEQALAFLQRQHVDVALLDIHLPGIDGMALAAQIKALSAAPALVFVTAHAEYAVQAFDIEALDYLTKPVRLERLQVTLQKAQRYIEEIQGLGSDLASECLVIHDRGRLLRVPLQSVVYIKAEQKYLTVRTLDASYLTEGSLGELEQKHGDRLFRVHRNALVARRSLAAMERSKSSERGESWVVRLHGVPECLPVSRRLVAAVRALVLG